MKTQNNSTLNHWQRSLCRSDRKECGGNAGKISIHLFQVRRSTESIVEMRLIYSIELRCFFPGGDFFSGDRDSRENDRTRYVERASFSFGGSLSVAQGTGPSLFSPRRHESAPLTKQKPHSAGSAGRGFARTGVHVVFLITVPRGPGPLQHHRLLTRGGRSSCQSDTYRSSER